MSSEPSIANFCAALYDMCNVSASSLTENHMAQTSDPVVIVSAARTPLGRFMGELSPFSAHQLGAHVIA